MSSLQTPPLPSSSHSPASSSASPAPSTGSASSAAAARRLSSWQLAAVCLFWELFSHLLPSSPHFHPESLLAGLHCREHQATTAPSSRFTKRARLQAEEKAEGRSDDTSRSSSPSRSPSPLPHDASACRCYGVGCLHLVYLHVSLLTAAGYSTATAENWLQHFNMELDARRADWPAIEDVIRQEEEAEEEEEEQETREEEQKAVSSSAPSASAFFSMKKRKRAARSSGSDNGDHHPLWSAHYYALSPTVKCLLLYLHTSWMLQDSAVHDFISDGQLRSTEAYGTDDAGRRYLLFSQSSGHQQLLTVRQRGGLRCSQLSATVLCASVHSAWAADRVHLYRETVGATPALCKWELLASNRQELEEAATVLLVQSSGCSQELVRRISDEAIATLEREGKLAERRQRRAARDSIDYRNILIIGGGDEGGRSRRQRKQVNYAEMDEGDIALDDDEQDNREDTGPSRARQRLQQKAEEEDEEYEEGGGEDREQAAGDEEQEKEEEEETGGAEDEQGFSQEESKEDMLPLSELWRLPRRTEVELKEPLQAVKEAQVELRREETPQSAADKQKAAVVVQAEGAGEERRAVAAPVTAAVLLSPATAGGG